MVSKEIQVTNSQYSTYFETAFKPGEQQRMLTMRNNALSNTIMQSDCSAVCMIPAHWEEPHVERALQQYNNFTSSNIYEIAVLVNAPHGVIPEQSVAFRDTIGCAQYCNLPITLYWATYPKNKQWLGVIRRELAHATLLRAAEAGVNPNKLLLITNDADMTDLDAGYLRRAADAFAHDDNLSAIAGPSLYPEDSFDMYPTLGLIYTFIAAMDELEYESDGYVTFHAANTIFRASDYMDAGGHKRSRRAQTQSVINELLHAGKGIGFERKMWVKTNARRLIQAYQNGVPIGSQYRNFCTPDDFLNYSPDDTKPVHTEHTISLQRITSEMQAMFYQQVYTIYQKWSIVRGITAREAYAFMIREKPRELRTLKHKFESAARRSGFGLEFNESQLSVTLH